MWKPYRYWIKGTESAFTGGPGHQGGAPTLPQWHNYFIPYSRVNGHICYTAASRGKEWFNDLSTLWISSLEHHFVSRSKLVVFIVVSDTELQLPCIDRLMITFLLPAATTRGSYCILLCPQTCPPLLDTMDELSSAPGMLKTSSLRVRSWEAQYVHLPLEQVSTDKTLFY